VKERKEHPHLSPLPSRERRLGNIFPSRERRLGDWKREVAVESQSEGGMAPSP